MMELKLYAELLRSSCRKNNIAFLKELSALATFLGSAILAGYLLK